MNGIDIQLLVLPLLSFLLVTWSLPKVIAYMKGQQMLSRPNERDSHVVPTPSMGGLAFLPSSLLLLLCFTTNSLALILLGGGMGVALMGAWDDRVNLSPRVRLLVEVVLGVVVFVMGFGIESLNGMFGQYQIHSVLGLSLTVLLIIGLMNAYNLIDGIDGLAGGQGAINFLLMALVFGALGSYVLAVLSLSISAMFWAFLRFNFHPAKIFMGDAGSLILGWFMSILFIQVWLTENWFAIVPMISLLLFPSLDMIRVFFVRMFQGRSPFSADRGHFHHLLLKQGKNHSQAALWCYLLTGLLFSIALALVRFFPPLTAIWMTILSGLLIYVWVELKYYKSLRGHAQNLNSQIGEIKMENALASKILD